MKTTGIVPTPAAGVTRREVLRCLGGAAAALLLVPLARADLVPLSETDPTAQALGYRADAAEVDAARFPQHRTGQTCASCRFFQNGACQLFPGKQVSDRGWCSAFAAKA